ncbi:MAG: hypothetical protein CSYNP_01619 [Syntrophus sp. SKADARSKE-3]|nr:hypothetical protein [Syntrophus sp. SKADARSKE-3]
MEGLFLHCGGKLVTRESLDLIPMPLETDSYKPVSHFGLTTKLLTVSQDLLKGFHLEREQYAVAKDGRQFFGVLNFAGDHPNMGMALAFRNSYDRSMSIGIAIGAQIFCCDNLALTGDITIMRKHTTNVWTSLEQTIVTTLYNSRGNYAKIVDDSQCMIATPLVDEEAWRIMGLLYGMDILGPRQLAEVKDLWRRPDHEAFEPRNLWSLYNNCTQALKSTPPVQYMDRHIALHRALQGYRTAENVIPMMDYYGTTAPEPFDEDVYDVVVNG